MKYIIHREGEKDQLLPVTLTVVETVRNKERTRKVTPARSLKIINHSPTGFEFGYGGSGPAQLALAILLDFTNDKALAIKHHQDFKWKFICKFDHPGGEISGSQIREFLEKQKNV